jgi:hypothetical protein
LGRRKTVFEMIKELPKGDGLRAKQIADMLPAGQRVAPATLAKYTMRELLPYGIVNDPSIGYHYDPAARRGSGADPRRLGAERR